MTAHNPFLAEIALLRQRVDQLEAENLILKAAQGIDKNNQDIARISRALQIPRSPAAMLKCLSTGGVKSRHTLFESYAHHDGTEFNRKLIDVFVHRIRKTIGREHVTLHWGMGISLSPEWCERIKAIMAGGAA